MRKFEITQGDLSLNTQRLNLRKIETSDAFFIYNLRSHEKNMQYVEMKPYKNVERAESFIEHVKKDMENQEVFFWVIETKANRNKVGTICLWSFSKKMKSAEVGYELLPLYQKKGYASEAIKAVMSFSKNKLELEIIDAITHELHKSSISLLLKNDFKVLGKAKALMPNAEDGLEMKLFRKRL